MTCSQKRRTCIAGKTKAKVVGYWQEHVVALGTCLSEMRRSSQPSDRRASFGKRLCQRRQRTSKQLLGRTIEQTAQDKSASLPADIETREKPLSRFRRQGIRPRSSQPRVLTCSVLSPRSPTGGTELWLLTNPTGPLPCSLRLSCWSVIGRWGLEAKHPAPCSPRVLLAPATPGPRFRRPVSAHRMTSNRPAPRLRPTATRSLTQPVQPRVQQSPLGRSRRTHVYGSCGSNAPCMTDLTLTGLVCLLRYCAAQPFPRLGFAITCPGRQHGSPGPHPSARPTLFPHSFPRRSLLLLCFWSAMRPKNVNKRRLASAPAARMHPPHPLTPIHTHTHTQATAVGCGT